MTSSYDGYSLREERVRRVLADVGSDLKTRQVKIMLDAELRALARDIEYLKDQLEVAQDQCAQVEPEAAAIEPEVAALRAQVSRLQKEKRTVAGREGLEELERSLVARVQALPRLIEEIKSLEKELEVLPARITEREELLHIFVIRKKQVDAEAQPLLEKVRVLEEEIAVLTSTKDIITGLVPVDLDPEIYESIKDDLQERVNEYLRDVREDIERIGVRHEALKIELAELRTQREPLAARKAELARVAVSQGGIVAQGETPETLAAEIEELNALAASRVAQRAEALDALRVLEAEARVLDAGLSRKRRDYELVKERSDALRAAKAVLDDMSDVGAAIEELETETLAHLAQARANEALLREGELVIERMTQMNGKLRVASQEFQEAADEFDRLVGLVITAKV